METEIEQLIEDFKQDKLTKDIEDKSFISDKGELVSVVLEGDYLQINTAQSNGWTRTNNYYRNGASEEIYSKRR